MDVFRKTFAMDAPRPTYAQRAALSSTPPLADYLLRLMERKQSNICLAAESADGMTSAELLKLASECGDAIVVLKLHSDAIWDLSPETVRDLTLLAKRKGFLLFDDRIFSGTSPSVAAQYSATHLHPGSWTSMVSAHIFHGTKVVKILRDAAVGLISNMQPQDKGLLHSYPYEQSCLNDSASYFSTRQSFDNAEHSPTGTKPGQSHPSGPRHASTASRTSFLSRAALADAYQAAGQRPPLHRKGSGHSTRQPLSPSMAAVAPFDRRKSSIVSINTTISSSTEYIGSPAAANARAQPSASITMSASSPNISPGHEDASQHKDDAGPPLSRGILLNTDIDPSIFQQGSIIGAYSADACTNGFKRACAKVARIDKDFVLGFVSDGYLAAQTNGGSCNETTSKFLNFVSNCCFADDCIHFSRERRRADQSVTPTRASEANGHESSEEEPDDSDADSSDSEGDASRNPGTMPADVSPATLVRDQRADVLIVGAPIIQAMDKREAVERYRRAGWQAYLQAVGQRADGAPTK